MTHTLTEQWERGELKDGDYYVEDYDGFTGCANIKSDKSIFDYDDYFAKVLAPVPSYEEWQALQKRINELVENSKNMNSLNQIILERCRMFEMQLEIAREALEFYAKAGHIDTNLSDSDDYILMKRLYVSAAIETGQKAREALTIGEKE